MVLDVTFACMTGRTERGAGDTEEETGELPGGRRSEGFSVSKVKEGDGYEVLVLYRGEDKPRKGGLPTGGGAGRWDEGEGHSRNRHPPLPYNNRYLRGAYVS